MADLTVIYRAREAETAPGGYVLTPLRELEAGLYAPVVSIGGLDGDITLTGDVVLDTFGALDDSPETDPNSGSATIPALLRGLLATEQLYAQNFADTINAATPSAALKVILLDDNGNHVTQSLADAISTISPTAALKIVALDDDGNHVLGRTNEYVTTDPEAAPATVTSLLRGILTALNQIVINTTPS